MWTRGTESNEPQSAPQVRLWRFLEAVPVIETFRGDVPWEGAVSEFESNGGNVFA